MATSTAWEERWDQAWPLVVDHLPARDLIALSLSSNSISARLDSRVWQQRAASLALLQPGHTADEQASRAVLFAVTALAHHVKSSRSPPPQTVAVPPWLPGQPGISRGFVRVDAATLEPPLLLTATQLGLLAHGSLAGHTAGVFISSCSSSPRSHLPCAFLAAVVSNKALVAELYIPRNTTPPDPWAGILSATSSSTTSSTCSSGSPSSGACPIEVWLSSSVQQQQPPLAADAGGGGRGGRAGRGRSSRRNAGGSSSACCWSDVHALISQCVADNASRCKAVRGTTVIPPGTATAAAVEQQLVRLAAAGAPLLDLRRLQWDRAAAEGRKQASSVKQQQQQQEHKGQQQWQAAAMAALHSALVALHAAAAAAEQEAQQQQQQPSQPPSEDDRSELLAALVEQLAELVPDVQLLVLPVLLPGGRAAQRFPSIGGTRLSAPRLLCLNVPFLMALRKHAWEQLPRLRHVLLLAGNPLPLPASPAHMQPQQQCSQGDGCSSAGRVQHQACSPGQVVPGTFTLQELEQQWQQQLHLGAGEQQQQPAEVWGVEQQDQWFEQQAAEVQQPLLNPAVGHGSSSHANSSLSAGGGAAGGVTLSGASVVEQPEQTLSRAAVDALVDMLASCMDRLC